LSAAFIGGLAPDIDQPTADLWHRLPAGSVIGRMITPMLGGHRFISHSIIGVVLFGTVIKFLLVTVSSVVLVDMNIVWWCFMIGFMSHLVIDMLTKDGVPWLFPIPLHFGVPPLRVFRIKSGGLIEKSFLFPFLLMFTVYLYYSHYSQFLEILKVIIKNR
jgi:inner membrane protein